MADSTPSHRESHGGIEGEAPAIPPASPSAAITAEQWPALLQPKAVVVRVKRKRAQEPFHSLWLEVIERPSKRLEQDFASISLSHPSSSIAAVGERTSRKLLFRCLDTIAGFGAKEAHQVDSFWRKTRNGKPLQERWMEWRHKVSCSKDKQEHLLSTAMEKQKCLSRTARFEQVWKKRRELDIEMEADPMHELFNLYDVVRVDNDEDSAQGSLGHHQTKIESQLADDQILCNYLPLLREYLPEADSGIQSVSSAEHIEDDYVYDVYGLQEVTDEQEDGQMDYPTVQVMNHDEFYFGESAESEYDSEDSNDENNPLNDYPEESDLESELDDGKVETDEENDIWDDQSRDEIFSDDMGISSADDRSDL